MLPEAESHLAAFQSNSLQELMEGLSHMNTVPYFNRYVDSNGEFTPWESSKDPKANAIFDDTNGKSARADELHIQWHQAVGVTYMVDRVFGGLGVLNADEVGLGKLIQILSTCSVLCYQREWYSKNKEFYGRWSESFPKP